MAAAERESREPESAFKARGFAEAIKAVHEEIQELYLQDEVPWVVGYSGGKDSSAILQLTWNAIKELPLERRKKPVYWQFLEAIRQRRS